MVWLSHYEEYPIYEPAEGGYYYAGNSLVESKRMSLRKAKKEMELLIDDLKQEPGWVIFNDNNNPGLTIIRRGRYIGNGECYVIERKKGKEERGRMSYC